MLAVTYFEIAKRRSTVQLTIGHVIVLGHVRKSLAANETNKYCTVKLLKRRLRNKPRTRKKVGFPRDVLKLWT